MNFIYSFDGPDASGKTMISQLVVEDLKLKYRPQGYEVYAHRMPGGTNTGAEIRKILKNPELVISPLTERLLFAADTSEFFHYLLRIVNTHEKSIHIVDRWCPITEYMYGLPRGVDPDDLWKIINTYMTEKLVVMPDILFLVDICLQDMNTRLHAEARPACRIEHLGDEYHKQVWEMYRAAACDTESPAREHCDELAHRVERLDNTRPDRKTVRDIANDALAVIEAHITERTAR
jgi:dTMP kinase